MRHADTSRNTTTWRLLVACTVWASAALVARGELEFYTDQSSYDPGGTIQLHISSTEADLNYSIRQGADNVEVVSGSLSGQAIQATPAMAYESGCGWSVSGTVPIDPGWPTGAYAVRVATLSGLESATTPFTLRPANPADGTRIVCIRPISTVVAYNNWGGKSYYYPSHTERAHVLSLNRPFANANSRPAYGRVEERTLAFLANYPVHYYDSIDLHRNPSLLDNYEVMLTVMHDEYVSRPMYDAYESFRNRGGDILFLGANNIYYQIRFDDGERTQICYKNSNLDPILVTQPELATGHWHKPPHNRPEEALVGLSYDGWFVMSEEHQGATANVDLAEHWAFVGASIQAGDPIGFGGPTDFIAGEWDNSTAYSPDNLQILASRQLPPEVIGNPAKATGLYQMSYYEHSSHFGFSGGSGARIFASGSINFGAALGFDPDVDILMTNLMGACLGTSDFSLAVNLGGGPVGPLESETAWVGSGHGYLGGSSGVADLTPEDAEGGEAQAHAEGRYGSFSYHVELPAGFYRVAVGVWQDPSIPVGGSSFGVSAEGQWMLADVDLASLAGEGHGQLLTRMVRVDDGQLDLFFDSTPSQTAFSQLHVDQVWPDLHEMQMPGNVKATPIAGGHWIDWDAPGEADHASAQIELFDGFVAIGSVEGELLRDRCWLPGTLLSGVASPNITVRLRDLSGNLSDASASVSLGPATAVPVSRRAPRILSISPNPFNPMTQISLDIPAGNAQLSLYDARGRLVRRFELRRSGEVTIQWDGRDRSGRSVASGSYFAELSSARGKDRAKLVLLR